MTDFFFPKTGISASFKILSTWKAAFAMIVLSQSCTVNPGQLNALNPPAVRWARIAGGRRSK
jgi:hypothetical protein